MRRLGLVLLACCATPLVAEDAAPLRSEEAVAVIRKADAAVKKIKAVRIDSEVRATGSAERFAPSAKGTAILVGWNGTIPQKFWVDITTGLEGSDDRRRLTGGGDGDSYFIVDHREKKAYEDMDPAVMGKGGNILQGLLMLELVHDHPFDDELAAKAIAFQGTETVAGVECHKVHVTYSPTQASTWFFSTGDFLPRRRLMRFEFPGQGEGTIDRVISKLEIDPEIEPSRFKLRLPEGYRQIDDFAP